MMQTAHTVWNTSPALRTALVTQKQDGQGPYNVTLRRVRAAIVAVEKQFVFHILSVCL